MPIDVVWKNEAQDIVIRTYIGRWNEDEFNVAEVTLNAMLDTINHRVDLIADMRKSNTFPPKVGGMFEDYYPKLHPRIGIVVVLGREINYDLMNLLSEKYPEFLRRYVFAKSLEEAEQFIAEDRAGKRQGSFVLPSSSD